MKYCAAHESRQVDAAVMACPFFQPVEVPQALQVGALLASQHAVEVAVRDAGREKEFHVDVLGQLLRPGARRGERLVERLVAFGRKLVEQLAAIAARTNRPDEPVALEALERRVDLADIDVPGPTEHGFKAVFHLISVEWLSLQEPQHAVLKRQVFDLPYSVCMLSMHRWLLDVKAWLKKGGADAFFRSAYCFAHGDESAGAAPARSKNPGPGVCASWLSVSTRGAAKRIRRRIFHRFLPEGRPVG